MKCRAHGESRQNDVNAGKITVFWSQNSGITERIWPSCVPRLRLVAPGSLFFERHGDRCLPVLGFELHRDSCLPILGFELHGDRYLPILGCLLYGDDSSGVCSHLAEEENWLDADRQVN